VQGLCDAMSHGSESRLNSGTYKQTQWRAFKEATLQSRLATLQPRVAILKLSPCRGVTQLLFLSMLLQGRWHQASGRLGSANGTRNLAYVSLPTLATFPCHLFKC
jgi:hypothetical protein